MVKFVWMDHSALMVSVYAQAGMRNVLYAQPYHQVQRVTQLYGVAVVPYVLQISVSVPIFSNLLMEFVN